MKTIHTVPPVSTVDILPVTLRTREIAIARGVKNPEQLRVAAGITAWESAYSYMFGTKHRLHISLLSQIMGALTCSLDELVYIGPPDRIPPVALEAPRKWHKGHVPATITVHVAERAKAVGFPTARAFATQLGMQVAPIGVIWSGEWGVLDCRNTLPRIWTALNCTKLSDLITIAPTFGQ
jgi:DNA-binding Xre family transcriptional regulator